MLKYIAVRIWTDRAGVETEDTHGNRLFDNKDDAILSLGRDGGRDAYLYTVEVKNKERAVIATSVTLEQTI